MSDKATSFDIFRWNYEDNPRAKTPERAPNKRPPEKTHKDYFAIRSHQRASRIHFGDTVTTVRGTSPSPPPKSNADLKQRHLQESEQTEDPQPRPQSEAKVRELVGSNIFGPKPKERPGRPATPERKRPLKLKSEEMTGNNLFKNLPPESPPEKLVSDKKIKELEGNDIFSDGEKPRSGARKPPDLVELIKHFNGTNPALPDEKATAYVLAHPKKYSDRHTSSNKIKEIAGNYDFFTGQDCLDFGKDPLGFPALGPHPEKRQELLGSEGFPPSTQFNADGVTVSKTAEKRHGDVKRQEILGNYNILSFAPNRRDKADYIKCTPEKSVSVAKRKEMVGNDIFSKA